MNALAHLPSAMQVPSLTGQSDDDAMLDTDPHEPDPSRAHQLDTLSAEDGVVAANLDDRLLHRDLKARLFGAGARVTIGRYEVLRRIGRGGMGTVYVAHDPELDRKIALKVLRADRRSGRERMLQEARSLARLSHPNVVAVHEVGLHDERVFVAMELVEGKTLRTWLEAGPSRAALFGVFLQAARGLSAAHRAGLVHRDFKPDNVLIGDDGRVRVVDFGVAKATDSLEPEPREVGTGVPAPGQSGALPELTLTGQLLGTPAYMAPEQFLGASVDARTDVFAFSVALFEALCGRRPFDGDDAAAVSWSVLQGQPRRLEASDVPPGLAALVEQGLRRDAAERPASLDGFVAAFEATLVPARQRRRVSRAYLAMASALGIAGGAALLAGSDVDPPATDPVVMAGGPATSEADQAEQAAFAAIAAAPRDGDRLVAAEAFLATYGEHGTELHRAIAHAAAGDVKWRRSCPADVQGLCITEAPIAASADRCATPLRGRITRTERRPALAEAARRHLEATVALAGVTPTEADEPLRGAFSEAIARSRVQLADAELERFLTLEVPAEIDFSQAMALSQTAFKLFYQQLSDDGLRLVTAYADVKQPGDPRWTLVAAARTGMVSETAAVALTTAPVPASLGAAEHDAYCSALADFAREPAAMAHGAYAYCVEKAEQKRLVAEPIVGLCRERLALYPEPAAQ